MDQSDFDAFAVMGGEEMLKRAGEALGRRLSARGLTDLAAVSPDIQEQLYREAVMETAVHVPGVDLAMLSRVLDGIFRSDLSDAVQRLVGESGEVYDAFDFASGVDAAVLMAFFGLPVAPMERVSGAITSPLTNEIDAVVEAFATSKADLVGYSSALAPFYVLITDCQDTIAQVLKSEPKAARIADLFARDGLPLPEPLGVPFVKACWIFRRRPNDRVGGLMYLDPRDDWGSYFFFAGFVEDGEPKGAGPDGLKPISRQLLYALLRSPDAHSFVQGTPKPITPTSH
jgi:hypothetical protein